MESTQDRDYTGPGVAIGSVDSRAESAMADFVAAWPFRRDFSSRLSCGEFTGQGGYAPACDCAEVRARVVVTSL